jgi:hypothetical protein
LFLKKITMPEKAPELQKTMRLFSFHEEIIIRNIIRTITGAYIGYHLAKRNRVQRLKKSIRSSPRIFSVALLMSTGLTKSAWPQFSTSANFLLQSLDARAVALGESYVAVPGGIRSLYWNPAGLSALEERIELTFTHRPSILEDILNYEQAALAYQLNARSGLAINYTYVDFGYPSFAPGEHEYSGAWGASYAMHVFNGLSAGLTLKRVSQKFSQSAHALAADLGALYQWQDFLQAQAWQSQLNFGASLSNLGEKVEFFEGQADPLPRILRLGAATQVTSQSKWDATGLHYAGMLVSFEYQNLLNDKDVNGEKIWEWGAGAELQFVEMIFLRLGYHKRLPKSNRTFIGKTFETGPTFGFGFHLPFHSVFKLSRPLSLQFDFASAPQGGWVERYNMFTFKAGLGI